MMRVASSLLAKPPKTSEWMAPMRAHNNNNNISHLYIC